MRPASPTSRPASPRAREGLPRYGCVACGGRSRLRIALCASEQNGPRFFASGPIKQYRKTVLQESLAADTWRSNVRIRFPQWRHSRCRRIRPSPVCCVRVVRKCRQPHSRQTRPRSPCRSACNSERKIFFRLPIPDPQHARAEKASGLLRDFSVETWYFLVVFDFSGALATAPKNPPNPLPQQVYNGGRCRT